MYSFSFANPYQLRLLVDGVRKNRSLLITEYVDSNVYINFDLFPYLLCFRFVYNSFTENALQYKVYVDFGYRQVHYVEEVIDTCIDDKWIHTNYNELCPFQIQMLHKWFECVCIQLKHAFYKINVSESLYLYIHQPIISFESDRRLPKLTQLCSLNTQQCLRLYKHHLSNRFEYKLYMCRLSKYFKIWIEWYFNPNNKHGYIKRFDEYMQK